MVAESGIEAERFRQVNKKASTSLALIEAVSEGS
jgi:hypothetical protein